MSDETTPAADPRDPLLDATGRSLLLARDAIDAALSNVAALRSRPAPPSVTRVVQRDPNAVPPTLGMHRRETTTTTTAATAKESAHA